MHDHTHEGRLQFCDCNNNILGATNEAAAPTGGGARRQVIVSGKRVKTSDVHAHCVIPKALEL